MNFVRVANLKLSILILFVQLYTRAWENVVALVLTNTAEDGGSQAYLGVKDTTAGIGLTLLPPSSVNRMNVNS